MEESGTGKARQLLVNQWSLDTHSHHTKKNSKWLNVKVTQSCPTLCDPMDSTVHGILRARILEWVAFPVSRGSSQPSYWTQVSCIAGNSLPAEPWGKPKNTGVGGLSPSPVDLRDPGIKLGSSALQVDFLPTELSRKPQNGLKTY